MDISKSKLDKAGSILATATSIYDEKVLEADLIVDAWRENHIIPLTEITLKLQDWLRDFGREYYLAQRLKRKPQIIRKLQRLPVRLSQLQDIGGCRIIFDNNRTVDEFIDYTNEKSKKSKFFSIIRTTDYRDKGRDISGYRAVHRILEREGCKIELQLRSNIQHYWCESIERTSVIYGKHLKENEGDPIVLQYFKLTSDAFHDIEKGIRPAVKDTIEIDRLKVQAEAIIENADTHNVFNSSVNKDFIRGMISRESGIKYQFNNWLIVFNWNTGQFMSWQVTERNPDEEVKAYSECEKKWPASDGYEVVMIGSSNVATISKTHNHYFGIESYHQILKSLDDAQLDFAMRLQMDPESRTILQRLYQHDNWGKNKVTLDTLKNHFCKDVTNLDEAIDNLLCNGFIVQEKRGAAISLNAKQKDIIVKYI